MEDEAPILFLDVLDSQIDQAPCRFPVYRPAEHSGWAARDCTAGDSSRSTAMRVRGRRIHWTWANPRGKHGLRTHRSLTADKGIGELDFTDFVMTRL